VSERDACRYSGTPWVLNCERNGAPCVCQLEDDNGRLRDALAADDAYVTSLLRALRGWPTDLITTSTDYRDARAALAETSL